MIKNFTFANQFFVRFVIIAIFLFPLPLFASNTKVKIENAAFKEAVQAVKDKNYVHAITLFKAQAKAARHDAQYNLAVLLNAGKGRPRNYADALYWSWQAQLGGIEDAENLADTIMDLLPEKMADQVRARVGEALQARIDEKDLQAIPQYANYHLTILKEPDYGNAYIWYSIAVALDLPNTKDERDDSESQLDNKNLVTFQSKSQELFSTYNFKPLPREGKGDKK
ncbi:hypothetical protein N8500_07540 [Candidatus Puniceispirillum sp.]|nr:hypothetical protein [Candidatus Puniceispirillum sp.]